MTTACILLFALCSLILGHSIPAAAQAGASEELEDSLFVLNPHLKDARGAEAPNYLSVVWIPKSIQKNCMGKTETECSTIDYCIRTTTKSVAMCQQLPASLRNLPHYPAESLPRRVFSISFSNLAPNIPGFDSLRQFFDNAPKGSLDRISPRGRFQARVRVTRKPNDDDFDLLEVLSVPPTVHTLQ